MMEQMSSKREIDDILRGMKMMKADWGFLMPEPTSSDWLDKTDYRRGDRSQVVKNA